MAAVLTKYGIDVDRQSDGEGAFSLHVAKADFADSIELLSRLGYPKEQFQEVNQIFGENRLISSPLAEKSKLSFATNQELSRTLSDIDGVARARVHIVLPELSPLGEQLGEPTASVTLHYQESADPRQLLAMTKRLVANAVSGLERHNVTVALFPAQGITAQTQTPGIQATKARRSASWFSSILWGAAVFFLVCGALSGAAYGFKRLA